MKLPFFTSFIILVLITQLAIRRSDSKAQKSEEEFWERERRANSTRKKSLENLNYIYIPMDRLPFGVTEGNDEILSCEKSIKNLSDKKIVNFTGMSNTDLKLEYGTANITSLSNYDQNYTVLVTTLQKWAKELYNAGFYKEATTILEFSVSTRSDVTASYRLLCDMYRTKLGLSKDEMQKKIDALVPIAESLNSLSKSQILESLNQTS